VDVDAGATFLILLVFCIGYVAIILESYVKVNKSAIALLIAVLCWAIYLFSDRASPGDGIRRLGTHLSDVSQIIFFLIGAMTLVDLVDSHRGFKCITDRINTRSQKKMLWIVALISFFLSSIFDNLTTTILMVSLLKKLVPHRQERFLLCCIVVIAANAGGVWTPIGDVTTTMLWINGQVSSFGVIRSLFLPSLVSLLIPLAWYSFQTRGRFTDKKTDCADPGALPGARVVFCLGVGGLVFVPVLKVLIGLPPFMGALLALGLLWVITDLIHHPHAEREHLRVPYILTRVDTSGILFFLGILLCVAALDAAGILQSIATWLNTAVPNQAMLALLIGFISAIIDNVPLVAATMGMYPLQQHPVDSSLWHMIAYAAGTGGSILIIGSSSGVALMGLEKIDFVSYMRKSAIPVTFGYLGGMGIYLLLKS
jgi:NhaD family Na+/H+ antiporter